MEERIMTFSIKVFKTLTELDSQSVELIKAAKDVVDKAYAPYSKFKVAAAVLLDNGEIVTGTNQENASSPAGICAEGTALSTASSLYPGVAVKRIAITAKRDGNPFNHPITPCGICRQRIMEYETRSNSEIEIIMTGEEGEIFTVNTVKVLLPLNFSRVDLKR